MNSKVTVQMPAEAVKKILADPAKFRAWMKANGFPIEGIEVKMPTAPKLFGKSGTIVVDEMWDERQMAAAEKLKLFNGRWIGQKYDHVYIAARSMADAARLLKQATSSWRNMGYEIKHYFHKNCWGNDMIGIVPERGLWVTRGHGTKPERLI